MTYAFSDGLIASEGGFWGLENYARYDYKILPDVGTHKKAQNKKNLDILNFYQNHAKVLSVVNSPWADIL